VYGVFITWGYTAQGITTATTTVYARVGDAFREILSVPLGQLWSTTFETKPTPTGIYDIVEERKPTDASKVLKWGPSDADDVRQDAGRQRRQHQGFRYLPVRWQRIPQN
jgi:hypothetical protein